ncbi:MAG: serine/threonine-protein kinase, partial [Myxococcota bacterium]
MSRSIDRRRTMAESVTSPTSSRTFGGRWDLVRPIGEGGMATVYEARHRVTGQRAALKVSQRTGDDESRARFLREARLASSIGHEGIAQVYDADVDSETGELFIAMELLEGITLRRALDEGRSAAALVRALRAVLSPLGLAHELGIVHRDLKPENVFLCEPEGEAPYRPLAPRGPVKLLDFGIARSEACGNLTQTGATMGTPHYMSPEQAQDARAVGPPSDVWAMGVMLYEVLAGEPPFVRSSLHAVAAAICTQPHRSLLERGVPVDPALSELVDRCLQKQPEHRPQDALALLRELDAVLGQTSLPPGGPSPPPSAARSRWAVRFRAVPGAGRRDESGVQ